MPTDSIEIRIANYRHDDRNLISETRGKNAKIEIHYLKSVW